MPDTAAAEFKPLSCVESYTVHGFRSSFMDWVAEVHPQRLLEAERALDHKIGNSVQRAYLRTDFLEQCRELAELWAGHLGRSPLASFADVQFRGCHHIECVRRWRWRPHAVPRLRVCCRKAPTVAQPLQQQRPERSFRWFPSNCM